MEHHHSYGPECEHHEEVMRRLSYVEESLAYYVSVLDDRLHTLGSHVEEIETVEAASEEESREEESSHEEEDGPEETPEGDMPDDEVVVEDDTAGLPDLATQEQPAPDKVLPMMSRA